MRCGLFFVSHPRHASPEHARGQNAPTAVSGRLALADCGTVLDRPTIPEVSAPAGGHSLLTNRVLTASWNPVPVRMTRRTLTKGVSSTRDMAAERVRSCKADPLLSGNRRYQYTMHSVLCAGMEIAMQRKVLNVGGGSKSIALPPQYAEFEHILLDIDPSDSPDIVCDARSLQDLEPEQFDAVYCSHNLEHYFWHDVPRVLDGFTHVLKPNGCKRRRPAALSAGPVTRQSPSACGPAAPAFAGFGSGNREKYFPPELCRLRPLPWICGLRPEGSAGSGSNKKGRRRFRRRPCLQRR